MAGRPCSRKAIHEYKRRTLGQPTLPTMLDASVSLSLRDVQIAARVRDEAGCILR
jgi:hypothetical protein